MIPLYLDACSIVPLLIAEPSSAALISLTGDADDLIVSDYGVGEVASALSRKVREVLLSPEQGKRALIALDEWLDVAVNIVTTTGDDVRRASIMVRRFELKLRMPDALHLAICDRSAARLVTGDRLMADAAAMLGLRLIRLP